MFIISVDGGTTNTRLVLMRGDCVIADGKYSFGVRDGLEKKENSYGAFLAGCVGRFLDENGIRECDVEAIVLSGMICSEHGLCEIPHIPAPADAGTLSEAMVKMSFPDVSGIPFYLIPGVKSVSSRGDLSETDIMRGEETELYGIIGRMNVGGRVTFVLPGSHCKIIHTDEGGAINGFESTISGELIRASAEHTILSGGIGGCFPKTADPEKLLEGFDYARGHGLTETLFKVRILQKFSGYGPEELYSVLCGAILSEDVRVIEKHCRGKVIIGGTDPFRSAFELLLNERTGLETAVVPDDISRYAAAYGAEFLYRGKIRE